MLVWQSFWGPTFGKRDQKFGATGASRGAHKNGSRRARVRQPPKAQPKSLKRKERGGGVGGGSSTMKVRKRLHAGRTWKMSNPAAVVVKIKSACPGLQSDSDWTWSSAELLQGTSCVFARTSPGGSASSLVEPASLNFARTTPRAGVWANKRRLKSTTSAGR